MQITFRPNKFRPPKKFKPPVEKVEKEITHPGQDATEKEEQSSQARVGFLVDEVKPEEQQQQKHAEQVNQENQVVEEDQNNQTVEVSDTKEHYGTQENPAPAGYPGQFKQEPHQVGYKKPGYPYPAYPEYPAFPGGPDWEPDYHYPDYPDCKPDYPGKKPEYDYPECPEPGQPGHPDKKPDYVCGPYPYPGYYYPLQCLGYAYIPWQVYWRRYSPSEALDKGTLFPELYSPYYPEKRPPVIPRPYCNMWQCRVMGYKTKQFYGR